MEEITVSYGKSYWTIDGVIYYISTLENKIYIRNFHRYKYTRWLISVGHFSKLSISMKVSTGI